MTLTEFNVYSRKIIPLGIMGFIGLMIMYLLLTNILVPTPTVTPGGLVLDTKFGKLKEPFIKNATNSARFKFTLDTIDGSPIPGTASAKVFFLPAQNTNVSYRLGTNNMAKTLGIDLEKARRTLSESEKQVTFEDEKQKLTVDITNFNFTYQYEIGPDDTFLQSTVIPPDTQINNKAADFLRTMNRYPEDLATGKTNIIYLFYDTATKQLTIKEDKSEANLVEIDFYRPDIEGFTVFTPQYFNSHNHIIFAFREDGFKIIKAQIHFYEKSAENVGIYPLKNGETAWKEIQEGKGLVTLYPPDTTSIVIKEMFLGFLDPEDYQEYMQPVYVFLGDKDNNFVGYIPAVDNSRVSP